MPRSSKWSLPFRFPNQNFVRIAHLPIHATCPTHSVFDNHHHLNGIWWRVQIFSSSPVASRSNNYRGYFLGVKQSTHSAGLSPPSSAEVKNACSTSTSPYVFLMKCLIKHRSNCTIIGRECGKSHYDILKIYTSPYSIFNFLIQHIAIQRLWLGFGCSWPKNREIFMQICPKKRQNMT
jgi:hypothetical protein